MEFSAKAVDPIALDSQCLVLGVFKGNASAKSSADKDPELTAEGTRVDSATQNQISALLTRGDFSGKLGDAQLLYALPDLKAKRVLLVGLGAKCDFNAFSARRAAGAVAMVLDQRGIEAADLCVLDAPYSDSENDASVRRRVRHIVEAVHGALYRYSATKGEVKPSKFKRATLLCAKAQLADVERGITEGTAIARGVELARGFANLPGNICTPTFFAAQAVQLAKRLNLKSKVLSEAEMERLKMGSLLSVSRGSREEAKLIILEYNGDKRGAPPVVLVGKGLTFDAGGISLKPASAMDEMKFDMCGGASVLGAVQAAAELELKINLVGIVPSSENLPDGAANKPGDVVTSMSGITIEILNTDAEGRLILCDALTYAERYEPSVVVDIATLTGACKVALGEEASGLFSNSDALAEQLLQAGIAAGDRAWRMPIWDEYDKQLESNFADFANIGGRYGGAITAACFLKQFTTKFDWAHLDIAGSAWLTGAKKGATGRPVPLLVEFLLNR